MQDYHRSMKTRFLVPSFAALLGAGVAFWAARVTSPTAMPAPTARAVRSTDSDTSARAGVPPGLSSALQGLAARAECPPAPPAPEPSTAHVEAPSIAPAVSEKEVREALEAAARQGLVPGSGPDAQKLLADIKDLGEPGTLLLLSGLASEDASQRVVAAQLLGQLNDSSAVSALTDSALNDGDERVAAVASQSLALMDIDEADEAAAREAFRSLAAKPNGAASELNAIYALCKLGDPEGTQRALQYLSSSERVPQAKAMLVINLARLPELGILPVMDQAVSMFADSPPVVSAAISYYRTLGTAPAQARLASLASNTALDPQIQRAASLALGSNSAPSRL